MEFLLPQILIYVNIRQICDQQKLFMCIKKPLVREQSMTNPFSTNVLLRNRTEIGRIEMEHWLKMA